MNTAEQRATDLSDQAFEEWMLVNGSSVVSDPSRMPWQEARRRHEAVMEELRRNPWSLLPDQVLTDLWNDVGVRLDILNAIEAELKRRESK